MRSLIYFGTLSGMFIFSACAKSHGYWQSQQAAKLYPASASMTVSFGNIPDFSPYRVTGWWIYDTLFLEADSRNAYLFLWALPGKISDSAFLLDGKRGNVGIYDLKGSMLAYGGGSCSLSLHQNADSSFNGYIDGQMYANAGNPNQNEFSSYFDDVSVSDLTLYYYPTAQ